MSAAERCRFGAAHYWQQALGIAHCWNCGRVEDAETGEHLGRVGPESDDVALQLGQFAATVRKRERAGILAQLEAAEAGGAEAAVWEAKPTPTFRLLEGDNADDE